MARGCALLLLLAPLTASAQQLRRVRDPDDVQRSSKGVSSAGRGVPGQLVKDKRKLTIDGTPVFNGSDKFLRARLPSPWSSIWSQFRRTIRACRSS